MASAPTGEVRYCIFSLVGLVNAYLHGEVKVYQALGTGVKVFPKNQCRRGVAAKRKTDNEDEIQIVFLLGKKEFFCENKSPACGCLRADQSIQLFFPQRLSKPLLKAYVLSNRGEKPNKYSICIQTSKSFLSSWRGNTTNNTYITSSSVLKSAILLLHVWAKVISLLHITLISSFLFCFLLDSFYSKGQSLSPTYYCIKYFRYTWPILCLPYHQVLL